MATINLVAAGATDTIRIGGTRDGRIRAYHLDLTECRGIEEAHAGTHSSALALHRCLHIFAVLGEVPRTPPKCHVLELCSMLGGPGMNRCVAYWIEQLTARRTGEGAE